MGLKIPDLYHGSMINGLGNRNLWLTGMQCALTMDDPQRETRYAFLSQECRAENVLALADQEVMSGWRRWWKQRTRQYIDSRTIFGRPPVEFVVLQTWDSTYAFHSRVYVGKPINSRDRISFASRINIDYVSPKYLSFDEAFERVNSGDVCPKDLFMHISWGALNLFCPCRYINYPNRDFLPDVKYLQPISGQVCYYEDGNFFVSYVACSVQADGTKRVEFCVRDTVNVIDAAGGTKKLSPLFPLMKWFYPVWFHEYSKPVPVDGTCEFYTYS